jgi:deoxyhypusine synthase
MVANGEKHGSLPASAADAVLKASAPVPENLAKVRGIEFDDFEGRDITVAEMVSGMAGMGFQASAVSEAVRIINDMVGCWSSIQFLQTNEILSRGLAKPPKMRLHGQRSS